MKTLPKFRRPELTCTPEEKQQLAAAAFGVTGESVEGLSLSNKLRRAVARYYGLDWALVGAGKPDEELAPAALWRRRTREAAKNKKQKTKNKS